MISVINHVPIYEINGKEQQQTMSLKVISHWNIDSFVVLEVPGTKDTFTVKKTDLEAAINNAINSRRHG